MERFIKFNDFFQATIINDEGKESEKNKDFFNLLFPTSHRKHRVSHEDVAGVPRVLGVKIAATHSGKVTENNSLYLPDKMKSAAKSWLEPFPKPILLHHEKEDDAIGRVKDAQYVDLSQGFRRDTGWVKRADSLRVGSYTSDTLIDAFFDGRLSLNASVDVVKNLLLFKDSTYVKDPTFEGLGFIELQASITDPDSIRKIIDERYLTGSIGARSDAAICSICKKDWVKDGFCDHRPGQFYDGELCVIIAGTLLYDEYSYVNRPADVHSRNLEIFADGKLVDSMEVASTDAGKIPEVWFNFDDSITEFPKKKEDIDTMEKETWLNLLKDKLTLPETLSLENFVDNVLMKLELSDENKESDESLVALAEENLKAYLKAQEEKENETGQEEEKEEEGKETADSQEAEGTKEQEKEEALDSLKQELGDDYDDLVGENPDESDLEYAQMIADAKMGRLELSDEETKALLDAKLSSKQRKGLSSSTFCGPNRSFPVPDCAHVTAARRLVGRYKGPGSKSAILACVSRKAKRLGCDGGKKDSIGIYVPDYFDTVNDDELSQMYNGLKVVLKERNLECEECVEIQNMVTALQDENKKLKETAVSAENEDNLKQELRAAAQLQEQLQQELLDSKQENRRIRASHVIALQIINGTEIEDHEVALADLMSKEETEFVRIEDELRSSVDIEKINALLQTGLAREPKEGVVVSDPGLRYTEEDKDSKTKDEKVSHQEITREFLESVRATYIDLRMRFGAKTAQEYIADLINSGKLPKEFPVEDKKD